MTLKCFYLLDVKKWEAVAGLIQMEFVYRVK